MKSFTLSEIEIGRVFRSSGSSPLQMKLKIFIACRYGKYWKLYCDKVPYRI